MQFVDRGPLFDGDDGDDKEVIRQYRDNGVFSPLSDPEHQPADTL